MSGPAFTKQASSMQQAGLDDLLHGAGFAVLNDRALLRVTGADATRWLNGMVTNSVQALGPGEANYNFLLNAQGRIQGDGVLYRDTTATNSPQSAEFLLATDGAQLETLQQHLDRYIIMDDVELSPAFTEPSSLWLIGGTASQQLARLDLPMLGPLRLAHADAPHGPVLLLTPAAGAVPQFELRASPATIAALQEVLRDAGLPELALDTLEALRVWEARPRFGADIGNRELPQETDQNHALHFAKGCYLGQEIVERIRSRGQVHRLFTAFTLEGSLPTLPATLEANGKPAGELTSAAEVTLHGRAELLALGYARREALDTHATLTFDGGTATPRIPPRSS